MDPKKRMIRYINKHYADIFNDHFYYDPDNKNWFSEYYFIFSVNNKNRIILNLITTLFDNSGLTIQTENKEKAINAFKEYLLRIYK